MYCCVIGVDNEDETSKQSDFISVTNHRHKLRKKKTWDHKQFKNGIACNQCGISIDDVHYHCTYGRCDMVFGLCLSCGEEFKK